MITPTPKIYETIRFSLGYYLYGGEKEALFNVSPAGAIKLTFFFLVDYKSNASPNHETCSFGSSESQRRSLASFPYPYVGYQANIQAGPADKIWAASLLLLIMVAALGLYRPYQLARISATPAYNWFARYALFCNVLAGLFLSHQLSKSSKLRAVYIGTDHCPLILSLVIGLKSKLDPEIVFRPHGGSVGWENKFRALTRGAFSRILPLSHFQADVFREWAREQNQPDNVTIPASKRAITKTDAPESDEISSDTCLLWLNQADLFKHNLDSTISLLQRALSVEPSLENCIFVSKTAIPDALRQPFERTEAFSSFAALSEVHSISNILQTCPSITLSSSVVTKLLADSVTIYCPGTSPIIRDKVARRILEANGYSINQLHNDLWKILPSPHSRKDLPSYFSEDS